MYIKIILKKHMGRFIKHVCFFKIVFLFIFFLKSIFMTYMVYVLD